MLIGNGEERTEEPAARQLAGWMEERGLGGAGRADPRASSSTSTCCVAVLAPKLAAVCVESASGGLVALAARPGASRSSRSRPTDAFELGVNAISLGDERVLSTAGARRA